MKSPLKVYIVERNIEYGCGTTVIAAKDRRACNHIINQLDDVEGDRFTIKLVPKTYTYTQPGIIHHETCRE